MRIRKIALAAVLGSTTALSVVSVAQAQETAARQSKFAIPAGELVAGLRAFARQSHVEVIYDAAELSGRKTAGVQGTLAADEALRRLVAGAGTEMVRDPSGAFLVRPVGNVGGDEAAYVPEEIIVTAQKRVESIQNVPISVSAFSAKSLDEQKIEGGSELVRAVPNVSFSKTNFASYNFSIRGVGTKALSVASDPAVAVSFNNTPLIRNRLFEQEYFDVQRVEVLRGPQGTLYGRNATGGVVNMIPNIANPDEFEGDLQLETGNYGSMRAKGMLNVPLGDTLAVRVAGAWTSRDGYDFNTVTNRRVNGRDLWSTRASAAWEPSDSFRVNAIWEHFNENDDRSRTGKQLCTRDPGPSSVGGVGLTSDATIRLNVLARGLLSQGCQDRSLYGDDAFGAPNGFALPNITAAATSIGLGLDPNVEARTLSGYTLLDPTKDPYAGIVQSRN